MKRYSLGWGIVACLAEASRVSYYLDLPLEEAMRTQRALRRFKPDPVPEDLLMHLLDLAIRAPSSSNQQKWDFVIVQDRQTMKALARLNRQGFGLLRRLAKIFRPRMLDTPILRSAQHLNDHFEETPVLVAACVRQPIPPFPFVAVTSAFGTIYPAVQNLLLACRGAGLGAVLITIPLWNQQAVKRALKIPWNVTCCCLIPMGWPLDHYGPNRRAPVQEVVHFDRYGSKKAP